MKRSIMLEMDREGSGHQRIFLMVYSSSQLYLVFLDLEAHRSMLTFSEENFLENLGLRLLDDFYLASNLLHVDITSSNLF